MFQIFIKNHTIQGKRDGQSYFFSLSVLFSRMSYFFIKVLFLLFIVLFFLLKSYISQFGLKMSSKTQALILRPRRSLSTVDRKKF